MIEKLLEAYEDTVIENRAYGKKKNKVNLVMKIFVCGIISGWIVVLGLVFFIQTQITLVIMAVYVGVLYISVYVFERVQHSQWKTNLEKYNEDLDNIAVLLKRKEFNLYEKNKIKRLIYKYYQSIEQHDKENGKKGTELKEFICTYIFPVVAFFAGKINTINATDSEWIVLCITIVIIVIGVRYAYSSIKEIIGLISWNQVEKEKRFVLKLQDLLDRDFPIEQEDLLSIK